MDKISEALTLQIQSVAPGGNCRRGVGVTKAPVVNIFVRDICDFAELQFETSDHFHIPISQVHPQLTCGDTCQIWTWYLGNQRSSKHWENNKTEEIGSVTSTPGQKASHRYVTTALGSILLNTHGSKQQFPSLDLSFRLSVCTFSYELYTHYLCTANSCVQENYW